MNKLVSIHDHEYSLFESSVKKSVAGLLTIFDTDASGLWEAYLAGIPEADRQHYNCRSCQKFIEDYGGLVAVAANGQQYPVLWNPDVPKFFTYSVTRMYAIVKKSKIIGVRINDQATWGRPQTGVWTHLSVENVPVFKSALKTASQETAEKKQDFIMLSKALADYPLEAAVQAVRVLQADALDRSEKTLGVAEWFLSLHKLVAASRALRNNLIWNAVASAPAGWCHISSTMIGTLLNDIVENIPYERIAQRWALKMHPLQYNRPTKEVSEGNVKKANEIIEKLGAQGSLARQFATMSDITETLWVPPSNVEVVPPSGGVFDRLLRGKSKINDLVLPPQQVAWTYVQDTLLPAAKSVEFYTIAGNFFSMVAPVNRDAPPLLQWPNQLSWYVYVGGSRPEAWGLPGGTWVPVKTICRKPCHWHGNVMDREAPHICLLLPGARDLKYKRGGGFFPESLRSEFHGIRSVLEAHITTVVISGDGGDANGFMITAYARLRIDGQVYEVTL